MFIFDKLWILILIIILIILYLIINYSAEKRSWAGGNEEPKVIKWSNTRPDDESEIIKNVEFIEGNLEFPEKVELTKLKKYARKNKLSFEKLLYLRESVLLSSGSENLKTKLGKIKTDKQDKENLIKWLRQKYPSLVFQTQDQLILFDEPTSINVNGAESLIKWIEIETCTLTKIPFTFKNISEKSERIVQKYGPGAMIFKYGFVKNIHLPNVLIL